MKNPLIKILALVTAVLMMAVVFIGCGTPAARTRLREQIPTVSHQRQKQKRTGYFVSIYHAVCKLQFRFAGRLDCRNNERRIENPNRVCTDRRPG